MDLRHLEWPFFDPAHRALAQRALEWNAQPAAVDGDIDQRCRALVTSLGKAGLLRYCVPASHGGALASVESRALCLLREALASRDGLADFAFAMQGLGSGAITLVGSEAQRARWLPLVARGEAISAFALSEPGAGSDVGAIATRARRDGNTWVIDGEKTWISNGGIAHFYCVFARTGAEAGTRGISAFVVPADAPGLVIAERIDIVAPHPLARIEFNACRLPSDALLGGEGEGFKLAMRTLDIFRASVGAAALGFARCALDAALTYTRERRMFGTTLAELQLTQASLADMATAIDAAALLVYRAAWLRDVKQQPTTREAAMAKLAATESAQRVIDAAVQLHGGQGVRTGAVVERLYREIRALRIYEGTSEIQKLVIAAQLLKSDQKA